MRRLRVLHLVLLASVLFIGGCKSNNKGKIEGTKWSSVPATIKGQSFSSGAFALDFSSDGKLTYRNPKGTFNGTYSLGMGDNVTLNLDQELAGRKSHTEKVKVEGDKLTMTDSDGTSLTFNQVK